MPEYLKVLILITSGVGLGLISFIVGAWLMFKAKTQPGSGESFLGNTKGEVFTIPEDGVSTFQGAGSGEPSKEEKHIFKKTEQFLKVLGGGK